VFAPEGLVGSGRGWGSWLAVCVVKPLGTGVLVRLSVGRERGRMSEDGAIGQGAAGSWA